MMTVNKNTMLFEDLTPADAGELLKVCEVIVFFSNSDDFEDDPYFLFWQGACGYRNIKNDHDLRHLATVFSQRGLLSVINYFLRK